MEKINRNTNVISANDYKRNLKLVLLEAVFTSLGIAFGISTITLFWNSVGMNQTEIGLSQALFMISVIILDIPMGYIADRCNRKVMNVIGDAGLALTIIFYATTNSFYGVVAAECLLGVFTAATNGVDNSFIKYNSEMLDPSGKLFKKVVAKLNIIKYVTIFLMMIVGGFIAKQSLRLSIGLSCIPYFFGTIIAFMIKDYGEKKEVVHKNPIKDMCHMYKEALSDKKTITYMIAYIVGKEITHSQIWMFTPLMTYVGVPVEVVSIGWCFDQLARIVGARIAKRMTNFKMSKVFAISVSFVFFWITVVLFKLNIVTVWVFCLNGITVGLVSGTLQAHLQEEVENSIQTSVMSVASTGARLLYIPVVCLVNFVGEKSLTGALAVILVIFLPISIAVFKALKKVEE